MSKKVGWGTEAGGKLSRKDAEYVQTVVKRAKDLIFYNDEFGRPERKQDLLEILYCFVIQNEAPVGPRKIAKLVDEYITALLKLGDPPEKAVPFARRTYANMLGKKPKTVKQDHLRYGTMRATKKRKM